MTAPTRVERLVIAVLLFALVASRVRLVASFAGSWTDEDQALLWYAASELLEGRVHEPYFYGQPYGSWLEALLAVPLVRLGVPFRVAVPAAATALGLVPWVALAGLAWRRRRPLAAIAVLAVPVAMALEGSILATMPRGLLPGVVVGVAAATVVLAWPRSPVAAAAFGFLVVIAASVNVGSGLVTGPVAVWFGVTALLGGPVEWRRRLAPLALGGAAGAGAHLLAQSFYRANPAHDVHHSPAFEFLFARMTENLGRLSRYLPAYAPEALRHWSFLVVVLVAVAVAVAVRHRTLAAGAAAATAVVLAVVVLGTAKANDGVASIFFPWARVYLALPWAVGTLALLPPPEARPQVPPTPRDDRRRALVGGLLGVAALASFAVREVHLDARIDALLVEAAGRPPVAPADAHDLERRCGLRRRLAHTTDVDVIVERYDRTAAYGCDALLPEGISTLFPEYDRRTWLLEGAEVREVPRLLVAGLDGCPPVAPQPGDRCSVADEGEGLFLLEGAARPVTTWARQLGIPVRPT